MNRRALSKILASLLFPALLFPACTRPAECPQYGHLGTLVWSAQTEAWLPKAYFQQPLTRVFQSETGQTKTFVQTYLETTEGPKHFVDVPCPNHPGDTTRTYFNIKRLSARMISTDSFAIDYGINIFNEKPAASLYVETDFFEEVAVALNHFYGNQADEFGFVSVITDLRNAEMNDIELYRVNNYQHYDELTVKGRTFTDVYTDPKPEVPGANIYFEKGLGVVAYVDDQNTLWTLVQ